MSQKVTTRVSGFIGEIVISNPERKNAMSMEMWGQLRLAAEEMRANDYVRVVVVHGTNATFVAGADISEFRTMRQNGSSGMEYDRNTEDALSALVQIPKPTIAAIEGFCIGGGVSIAVACDFQVAHPDAKFQIPAARLGISYPLGSLGRLVNLIGSANTKRIIFTAARLDANEALSVGLVSEIASGDLDARVEELARQLGENAPLSILATKRLVASLGFANDALKDLAGELFELTLASADYAEALNAFDEQRKPNFQGR